MKLTTLLEFEDPVRNPTDDEHDRAAAAIKKENPRLKMHGIGVDKKTGVIYIDTEVDEFELHPDGKLKLVNEAAEMKKKSIKELQARKDAALEEYHRICKECDDEIEAIRKARGQKKKEPSWKGYREPGRSGPDHGPRGAMG